MSRFMLARPSKEVATTAEAAVRALSARGGWWFEVKWDGVRTRAEVEDGQVHLLSRQGVTSTLRYPEVVDALGEVLVGHDVVLDGEMVCLDDDGRPSFARVHRRDAQARRDTVRRLVVSSPATFVAFDVLSLDGRDLRTQPYTARRALLDSLGLVGPHLQVSTTTEDGPWMWEFVRQHALEGVVAKRGDSRYVGQRSAAWVKCKKSRVLNAVVCGVEPGNGSRAASFGALHLALVGPAGVVQIGSVGSGFNAETIEAVRSRLGAPFVVEVEYMELTPTGQLRFPVFRRIADEVGVTDCTIDQIGQG